ncbi:UDP-3-O-(3-hydroxymyristoyl)glucosamine N-acyltransferase [Geovibrio sp. ADMFC3]
MERKKISGKLKLSEIAAKLGGRLEGKDAEVTGIRPVDSAESGCVSFLFDKKLAEAALKGAASAFIIPEGNSFAADRPVIYVKEARAALAIAIDLFYPVVERAAGISEKANIAPSAKIALSASIDAGATVSEDAVIGAGTVIYPNSFIGSGTVIGDNCVIYPNVTVYHGCRIGNGVVLHSGSVIGADGFGYYQDKGVSVKIPQVGGVVLGNNVEVGSNSCVDRGALGDTVIGEGTKIDNQVQIGHNTRIGKHCIFVGQTGIAGSCEIGDYVVFGARSGTKDHVRIASKTIIAAQGGVDRDIDESGIYGGFPIQSKMKWMKNNAALLEISDIRKKVNEISRRLNDGSETDS